VERDLHPFFIWAGERGKRFNTEDAEGRTQRAQRRGGDPKRKGGVKPPYRGKREESFD
jgi:hypothetical protein